MATHMLTALLSITNFKPLPSTPCCAPLNSNLVSCLRAPLPSFSFFSSPSLHLLPNGRRLQGAPKFSMRVASKQAYICRDCGYIYNDRTPFEKLDDNFSCPVCAAPKRRFRPYQSAVGKNVNNTGIRKARKEELKRNESIGKALPIAAVVGVAALAAFYFLNTS